MMGFVTRVSFKYTVEQTDSIGGELDSCKTVPKTVKECFKFSQKNE